MCVSYMYKTNWHLHLGWYGYNVRHICNSQKLDPLRHPVTLRRHYVNYHHILTMRLLTYLPDTFFL